MESAVDRIGAEIEQLAERITQQIIDQVPEYGPDEVARGMLLPYVRQNADEVLRVLRGIETTTAAARNVALADATATGLSLDAVERTFQVARDAYRDRLRELADDDEDLTESFARLDEAYVMVIDAIRDEYRAAKRRLAAGRDQASAGTGSAAGAASLGDAAKVNSPSSRSTLT